MNKTGIDVEKACDNVVGCPFRGPFYQLLRQFLLAEKLREIGRFDFVNVLSIEAILSDELPKEELALRKEIYSLGREKVDWLNPLIAKEDKIFGKRKRRNRFEPWAA